MSTAFFCPPLFCCVQHQASNLHVIIRRECMHVGTTISFRRDEGSGRQPPSSRKNGSWKSLHFFPARPPPPPFSRSSSTRPPLILREEGLPSSSRHAAMMGHKQKRKEEIKPGIRFTIGYPKYRRFLCKDTVQWENETWCENLQEIVGIPFFGSLSCSMGERPIEHDSSLERIRMYYRARQEREGGRGGASFGGKQEERRRPLTQSSERSRRERTSCGRVLFVQNEKGNRK